MKKILILSWEQYGYHTDNYMYCKYLKSDVTIINYDYGLDKLDSFENTTVLYVKKRNSNKISRINYLLKSIYTIMDNEYDVIFIRYFRGCSLLKKIFRKKKMIVDVRTGSVDSDKYKMTIYNNQIRKECNKFDQITVISDGLRELIGLDYTKSKILPLGAEYRNVRNENIKKMRFIYVGTFHNRNIVKTIEAFYLFENKYGKKIDTSYTIVGFSENPEDIEEIKNIIIRKNLSGKVNYIGRVKHNMLEKIFEEHDVGISYIPIKECFQYQPPTKTYEYILNGMVCLATRTLENKKIINNKNGILIGDDILDVMHGMEEIYKNIDLYNRREVAKSLEHFTWENIVNEMEKNIY